MPAMLDDPTAAIIYRTSGEAPYPRPHDSLPASITPRHVTLRDRSTMATLVPFSTPAQVPKSLVAYLCALLNREIGKGDTYPMVNLLTEDSFGPYWFANFGAVMLLGELADVESVWAMEREMEAAGEWNWGKRCLGSFYIKPNYPGRSSHVCNGGFLVTDAARNRGVGRLMGEGYLEWAPKLGYTYSVFNLVYETNIASVRIWDALGFKRIGRVPGCGNLKSHPDTLIDAIIFGRDLNGEAEDYLSEERFDKIRYYLKTGMYPNGSDRAEKSRLRSAGAHYRLVTDRESGEEKLMLKDKEVISDPQKQYEIAHKTHSIAHAGINKTTASIADKYHWIRIKETVSQAIRNCADCRETSKPGGQAKQAKASTTTAPERQPSPRGGVPQEQRDLSPSSGQVLSQNHSASATQQQQQMLHSPGTSAAPTSLEYHHHQEPLSPSHVTDHHEQHQHHMPASMDDIHAPFDDYDAMPVDPQIMEYEARNFGTDPNVAQQQHQSQAQYMHPMHDHDNSLIVTDDDGTFISASQPHGTNNFFDSQQQQHQCISTELGGGNGGVRAALLEEQQNTEDQLHESMKD
ncbi:hypothetical protein AAFC00_006600 [Neodothiora populina]|uniref:N-acetyltransferase domain-containing protein n=1 Tax=Neodothiora populina TaxID=2781224 RepID=A0ABR3PB63_9PEZI